MDEKEMYKSLIKWLKILELSGVCNSAMDLSTGVTLGELLALLVPNSPKIRDISISDNWRSKASNLKKIVDSVVMYYSDELDLSLDEHLVPDVFKISENNDEGELIKLIKLLLGIAVNCENKLHYITQIMEMEEDIQRNIMKALQEIENIGTPSSTRNSINMQNFEFKDDDRETLAQKLHEKENLISFINEEKSAMQHEIIKLKIALEKYESQTLIGEDGISMGAPLQGSSRMNELRKQIENLKNDLLLSETIKEDLKMKSMQQEKQISSLQMKIDELTKASNELSQIKDEVDILREANEKSKEYERQLTILRKKLEDYNDIKRQIKQFEERTAEYLKQNIQYEEEAKKLSAMKSQVDLYKNQLDEFHIKLDSEMQKTVKAEFEGNIYKSKLLGVTRERDNFKSECDNLREKLDELKCNNTTSDDDDSTNISRELFGDKISRLEAENKALREGQQTVLSDLLNDSNVRNEKLRDQLKSANQKILVLSSHTDVDKSKNGILEMRELCDQRERLLEEAQSQISNSHQRIRQLEASLDSKTHDLTGLELKYKKCVEKAKEVIKGLGLGDSIVNEVPEQEERMSIAESKLIVAAFYRMSLNLSRENVDSKLASLSQGQSFMSRQRQPASRKPITNYKN